MVLLEVEDLKVHFEIQDGWVKAVDGVSFSIDSGETMGLVGESGCGKTTAAYAITQLLPPNGRIKGGRIFFREPDRVAAFRKEYDWKLKDSAKGRRNEISRIKSKLDELNRSGRKSAPEADEMRDRLAALTYSFDLLALSTRKDGSLDDYNEDIRKIRWTQISMIFQGAMNAFNPVFRVGDQIIEAITLHEDVDENVARERAKELFEFVGIAPDRIDNYPHEFSGGMKQRAMIALALALNPSFVIADEPTTALDVITQDRILAEIKRLQEQLKMAMMIITHDVSVVAEVSDKIGVMYAGLIMEIGQTSQVFKNTAHPYTAGLLGSFPSVKGERRRLVSIPGFPPDLVSPPSGCPFHPRCQYAQSKCQEERPEGVAVEPGHISYCHFAEELWEKLRRTA
ncbi:MAG: ABC transporter ATP-binding protein [Methanobacteriota archaeon]|nr:MAG: ABC transporter ATP-binding protein [Euryarchaeota archaeon]